jgi:hypothetical protein
MEIARMFGQWPHEILTIPTSEYRRLQRYYFAVREAEKPKEKLGDSELPPGVTLVE